MTVAFQNNSILSLHHNYPHTHFQTRSLLNKITSIYTKKQFQLIQSQTFLIFYFFISILLIISLILLYRNYFSSLSKIYTSSIASSNDFSLISEWINPKHIHKYTLLYQATRDGGLSTTFHKLCDDQGPTLTLISTKEGWIFGGYTDTSWEYSKTNYFFWKFKSTNNTFIFSLSLRKKYPPSIDHPQIICSGSKGPAFGQGFDILVSEQSLTIKSSCNSPSSFENLLERNEFNGNNNAFIAKEIEVYKVDEITFWRK